jgi:hypothetical protein
MLSPRNWSSPTPSSDHLQSSHRVPLQATGSPPRLLGRAGYPHRSPELPTDECCATLPGESRPRPQARGSAAKPVLRACGQKSPTVRVIPAATSLHSATAAMPLRGQHDAPPLGGETVDGVPRLRYYPAFELFPEIRAPRGRKFSQNQEVPCQTIRPADTVSTLKAGNIQPGMEPEAVKVVVIYGINLQDFFVNSSLLHHFT